MAGHDVEELLGGPRALTSWLREVDQGHAGGPGPEGSDDVGVGDVGQLVALPGEASDVLAESFPVLLSAILHILGVLRVRVGALEISHKDLLQVRPALNPVGQKVL